MPGQFKQDPAARAGPRHPYSPAWAVIPRYAPNESPLWVIAGAMGLMVAIVVGSAAALASRLNPRLRRSDKLVVCWFAMCGFLHVFFEGYFVFSYNSFQGRQDLFAQLWKEYGLSDSRYLTFDTFVVSIEMITMTAWGPLCLATAGAIIKSSPLRHPLQIIACTAHLYGVSLYYLTSHAEFHLRHVETSRPEFLYYWVYYVGFNFLWVAVPIWLLVKSMRTLRSAVQTLERVQGLISELQNKIEDLRDERDDGGHTSGEEELDSRLRKRR